MTGRPWTGTRERRGVGCATPWVGSSPRWCWVPPLRSPRPSATRWLPAVAAASYWPPESRTARAISWYTCRESGAETVQLSFDAADTTTHDGLVNAAFAEGDIDLVLVAFGQLGDPSISDDPDGAVALAAVNYLGAVSLGLRVLPRLRAQGHGTIVVLSSVAGERVRASNYLYGSTKAGLDGFFLGMGDAERDQGIRVMVVRPGFVATRMTAGLEPAPFATTPEGVALDVVRGLERGSEIVWSPPVLRAVMSGLRHVPRALFRRLPV